MTPVTGVSEADTVTLRKEQEVYQLWPAPGRVWGSPGSFSCRLPVLERDTSSMLSRQIPGS